MPKKRGWATVEEVMARLEQDTEYQKRIAEREGRLAHVERMRAEIDPILEDLKTIGVVVEEWNDVVSRYAPLTQPVVELLLRWLPRVHDQLVQEVVIRTLAAAPTVHYDGRVLTRLFEATDSQNLRWAIANTLSCTQPEGVDEWVARAVQNPEFGKGREMLAIALARLIPHSLLRYQPNAQLLRQMATRGPIYAVA